MAASTVPPLEYPNLGLWDDSTWADRHSPVGPVARRIQALNHDESLASPPPHPFADRTDGSFDSKTHSTTYPDVVQQWRDLGIQYICSEMGGVTWIAMLPDGFDQGARDVLVVLHDADYSNPDWAMEAVERYRSTTLAATAEGVIPLYVVTQREDPGEMFVGVLQELLVRFHVTLDQAWLDLRASERAGTLQRDVGTLGAGWNERLAVRFGGLPVLNITDRWHDNVSYFYRHLVRATSTALFDPARLIRSTTGERMADAMALELAGRSADDPAVVASCQASGVVVGKHHHRGQQWISLAPAAVDRFTAGTLPVMLVFQEVTAMAPYQAVLALAAFHEYRELVAAGELMLLFFALEDPDDNDLFAEILEEAMGEFPIDPARVYVTGHSHNGQYAMEFARRHHRSIAAVASLGISHGMPSPHYTEQAVVLTDDKIELMRGMDIPVINIIGATENELLWPEADSDGFANAVDCWQRRLRAFRCQPTTGDAMKAAREAPDLATRMLGVPCDRTEIQVRFGAECYIGDVQNERGEARLRLVSIENLPHIAAPQMPSLSWDFVRRWERDLVTGAVVDRYRAK